MTRRSLLRRALWILGCGPAWPVWVSGCGLRRIGAAPLAPGSTAFGSRPQGGPLAPAERETLIAFGEVVAAGRALEPAERRSLVECIEERTRRPGYLDLYRTTANTLDRLAGQPFVRLDVGERTALVARHKLGDWQGSSQEAPASLPAEIRAIRAHVIPDLIHAYYASSAGWAVVGYQSFPGRCGELTRYTRPEA